MLLFCAKTIMKESHNCEVARLEEEEEEEEEEKKKKKKKKEEILVRYFRDAFLPY